MAVPEYNIEEAIYTQIAYNTKKQAPIIIQTFTPHTPIAKNLIEGNYRDFLSRTLQERKQFDYPPYAELAYIWVEDKNKERVKDIIYKLASKLQMEIQDQKRNIILHYDKELFERRAGEYRQKIVLRGQNLMCTLETIKGEIIKNR